LEQLVWVSVCHSISMDEHLLSKIIYGELVAEG
jgi:hypothetical protein